EPGNRRAGRVELRPRVADVAREREARDGRGAVENIGIAVLPGRLPARQGGDNLARVSKAHEHQSQPDEHGRAEEETGDSAVHPSHGTAARIASLLPDDGVHMRVLVTNDDG